MPVQPPVNAIAPFAAGTSSAAAKPPSGQLDKDAFLKLIAGQLRNQDPMNGGDAEGMMAQMTQLATLEQVQNMAANQQVLTAQAAAQQAISLIGKTVKVEPVEEGAEPFEAKVERVVFEGGVPLLILAGHEDPVALGQVLDIR